ncbi:MAG TPA: hypothetical protein VFX58_16410, partial [Chitinophagaceae bacterium]|nr:hypothetical protein [Chitinophagaceae bacterium]
MLFFVLLVLWKGLPKNFKIVYLNLYTIVEYLFFAFFLWSAIQNTTFKKVIVLLSGGFVIFQIIYFLTTEIVRLDSIPVGIETILVFIYIFFFLYEYFKSAKSSFINSHYCFWLSVGILIYLGGSFFFNILANHMLQEQVDDYWYFTYIAETIKNFLFIISISVASRQTIEFAKREKTNLPYLDMV